MEGAASAAFFYVSGKQEAKEPSAFCSSRFLLLAFFYAKMLICDRPAVFVMKRGVSTG